MRCDWPYSLKPLRQRVSVSVGHAFSSAHALFRSCGQSQRRLGAQTRKTRRVFRVSGHLEEFTEFFEYATKVGEISGLGVLRGLRAGDGRPGPGSRGRAALRSHIRGQGTLFDGRGRADRGRESGLAAGPIPSRIGTPPSWDRLLLGPGRASPASDPQTITDEISLGILGENAFHGTPRNPTAPRLRSRGGRPRARRRAVGERALSTSRLAAIPEGRSGCPRASVACTGSGRPTGGSMSRA